MERSSRTYLNVDAVASWVGVARLLQAMFGCATFSLVAHRGGFSAAYGSFCISVWCFCFAVTVFILTCEFTRLHSCLSISWGNFTAAFAMLATLMSITAAVIYPLYIQFDCDSNSCESFKKNLRTPKCLWELWLPARHVCLLDHSILIQANDC